MFWSATLLGACQKSEPQPISPSADPVIAAQETPTAVTPVTTVGQEAPTASAASTATDIPPASQTTGSSTKPWALGPGATGETTASNESAAPGAVAANAGTSRVSGCLAEATRSVTRGATAPWEPVDAASKQPLAAKPWRVVAQRNDVVVTHQLEHACCLKGEALASVNGDLIVVEERLSGQPCRCVCTSTIETRLTVPAGSYRVETVTVTNGVRQVAHSGHVAVALSKRKP